MMMMIGMGGKYLSQTQLNCHLKVYLASTKIKLSSSLPLSVVLYWEIHRVTHWKINSTFLKRVVARTNSAIRSLGLMVRRQTPNLEITGSSPVGSRLFLSPPVTLIFGPYFREPVTNLISTGDKVFILITLSNRKGFLVDLKTGSYSLY